LDLFSNSLWICVIWGKYVSLICSYIGLGSAAQFPPSFGGSVHIACLLKSQVWLRQLSSIARLCSLSLCIVKVSRVRPLRPLGHQAARYGTHLSPLWRAPAHHQTHLDSITPWVYTVREKTIWSPADFVHLPTDKEMIRL
jgi:hypothetical protein